MSKSRKSSIKKHLNNNRARYALISAVIALPVTAYLYNSTDVLRCRDCAYQANGVIIRQNELEASMNVNRTFYAFNNQDVDMETLKKDTIEQLIKDKKIQKEANSKGIKVTEEEINQLYQFRITQNGSEEKLLKKIKDYYGYDKVQYLQVLKMDILRDKIQQ